MNPVDVSFWKFVFSVVVTVAFIFGGLLTLGFATDSLTWTRTENDCYVRTYTDNRVWWSGEPSTTTIQTYCPVEK